MDTSPVPAISQIQLPASFAAQVAQELRSPRWSHETDGEPNTILGSQLGLIVSRVLIGHGITPKLIAFGGLRKLAETQLGSVVRWHRKISSPGDDFYLILSPSTDHEAPSSAQVWLEPNPESEKFWVAFSNPSLPATISLDHDGTLRFAETHTSVERPLQKVMTSDYFAMAMAFAMRLDAGNPAHRAVDFLSKFQAGNFIAPWLKYLRGIGAAFIPEWESYRIRGVIENLQAKLQSNNVMPEKIAEYSEVLKKSQALFRRQRLAESRTRSEARRQPSVAPSSERTPTGQTTDLRQIVFGAIAKLSNDDVRRIWLPLGAVMDALEHAAKQMTVTGTAGP
jgi:hypothetical protein